MTGPGIPVLELAPLESMLDAITAATCPGCGLELKPAGSQCAACGTLPPVTREELAEALSAPGALAEAQALQVRARAVAKIAEAERDLRAADRLVAVDALMTAWDLAEAKLDTAQEAHKQAAGMLEAAAAAEQQAAGPLREAEQNHREAVQGEEAARRLRKGARAETDARLRLVAATDVLSRYQAEAAAATQAREAAAAVLEAAGDAVSAAERGRDAAEDAAEHPSRIPLAAETVRALAAPLVRLALGRDVNGQELAPGERMMAVAVATVIAETGGALKDIRDRAREQALKDAADEQRKRPVLVNDAAGDVTVYSPLRRVSP